MNSGAREGGEEKLIVGREIRGADVRRERDPRGHGVYCRQGTCGFVGFGASSRGA